MKPNKPHDAGDRVASCSDVFKKYLKNLTPEIRARQDMFLRGHDDYVRSLGIRPVGPAQDSEEDKDKPDVDENHPLYPFVRGCAKRKAKKKLPPLDAVVCRGRMMVDGRSVECEWRGHNPYQGGIR